MTVPNKIWLTAEGLLADSFRLAAQVLDSGFAQNRQLYFCYSQAGTGADAGKNGTALARAQATALLR